MKVKDKHVRIFIYIVIGLLFIASITKGIYTTYFKDPIDLTNTVCLAGKRFTNGKHLIQLYTKDKNGENIPIECDE